MNKTGIELIAQERAEQIEKHSRTIQSDSESNKEYQLNQAAQILIVPDEFAIGMPPAEITCPPGWDLEIYNKMIGKSYKERLIMAGALIAAEIDRIQLEQSNS